MNLSDNALRRLEVALVTMGAWLLCVSIALVNGGPGLSWDAINHHIYLGWIADKSRLDRDFWAAASQSYQFPYLFWPAYKFLESGLPAKSVGVILATLQTTAMPALWLIVEHCIPERTRVGLAMRVIAMLLALASGVVVSLIGTTANDLLASVPLLWAIALTLQSPVKKSTPILSGFLAGASIALKLSNAPLVLMMPILWGKGFQGTDRFVAIASALGALLIGYIVFYGYWGWTLYKEFGSPFYPYSIDILGFARL